VSRTLRLITALGAVFFALVGLSACGGGVPSDSVVSVDGVNITKSAFKHWMGVAAVSTTAGTPGAQPVVPEPPGYTACIAHLKESSKKSTQAELKKKCEQQYKAYLQEVLSFLTSSQWVLSEANALGVKLSDKEVRKQFTTIKNQQFRKPSEFEKFLQTSGQTVSDLLLRVKLNMLSTKIQTKIVKGKKVTEADVTHYYNTHKSQYGTPEKRAVYLILTKNEAQAANAKKEIESGKSFSAVAKKVSIDPVSKTSGGYLPEVAKGQENPTLDKALFSAPAGALTGPVKTPYGYYLFKVKSSTPGTQQSLAQARTAIKSQLNSTREQTTLSKWIKEFKKRWKAKTDCASGYVVANCKQYKEPKGKKRTTTTR
jgi:parvulin-like peptidyl-prolyl isomerase